MSGDVNGGRGQALPHDESALIDAWWTRGVSGDDEERQTFSDHFEELADELEFRGDFAGALRNFDRSRDIRMELAWRAPASPLHKRNLSISFSRLGRVYCKIGDLLLAQWSYEETCRLRGWLASRFPAERQWHADWLRAQRKLQDVFRQQDAALRARRTAETEPAPWFDVEDEAALPPVRAIAEGIDARDIDRALVAKLVADLAQSDKRSPTHVPTADGLYALGERLRAVATAFELEGELSSTLWALEQAYGVTARLAAAESENGERQRDLLRVLRRLGMVQQALDRLHSAERSFEREARVASDLARLEPGSAYAQLELCRSQEWLDLVRLARHERESARSEAGAAPRTADVAAGVVRRTGRHSAG